MTFEGTEDLQFVTEQAVQAWETISEVTRLNDPILPPDPEGRKTALERDFQLFAKFWQDDTPCNNGETGARLIRSWLIDRVTCECSNEAERRASIICGNEFFYSPTRISILLQYTLSERIFGNLKNLPNEDELKRCRGSHVLYYGIPLTDSEITRLIFTRLLDSKQREILQKLKRHRTLKPRSSNVVIEPKWHLVKVTDEKTSNDWTTVLGCVLFHLNITNINITNRFNAGSAN